MDYKNELDKIIDQLDDFSNTPLGHYILNFLIGIAGILIVGTGIYLGYSFITWSFPSLAWILSGPNSLYRLLALGYAFVVFMITLASDDEYPM